MGREAPSEFWMGADAGRCISKDNWCSDFYTLCIVSGGVTWIDCSEGSGSTSSLSIWLQLVGLAAKQAIG